MCSTKVLQNNVERIFNDNTAQGFEIISVSI